jgi:competence protein ComEC
MRTAWIQQPLVALLLLTVCALPAVAWWYRTRDTTGLLLLLVLLAGSFRILPDIVERRHARELYQVLDTAPHILQGRAVSFEALDNSRSYFVLADVTMTSAGELIRLPGRVKVALHTSGEGDTQFSEIAAGSIVQVFAALREPRTLHNFFGTSTREQLALQRVYYTATVQSAGLVQVVKPALGWSDSLRRALVSARMRTQSIIARAMPDHAARLMVCMLFNDMRQLSEEDTRIFRDSGTMHLFAVSGMHVAIFALILNTMFRTLRFTPRVSWVLVIIVLFLYLVLLDFLPPATRAFLMVLACTLGRILGREIDSISSLAFGIFCILLLDPLAPWQVGFQLSVMGVVAILLIVPIVRFWFDADRDNHPSGILRQLKFATLESLAITAAVTITLLPLQFYYFHQLNLLSPVANLLEAVLAGPVLGAGLLVIAAGFVSSTLASVAGAAAAVIMELVYRIAQVTADASSAIIHIGEIPVGVLILFYLVLFGGYHMVFRDTPEFRLKARARLLVHGCSGICLLAVTNWWGQAHQPLRIWFFDVGQGDSTLVQLPNGQTILVDAGTNLPDMGRMVVIPQLKALGVSKLDYVVATHPDTDHTGGIPTVLQHCRVELLVEPDEEDSAGDEILQQIRQQCRDKAITEFQPSAGDLEKTIDGCTISVLNPPKDPADRLPLKDNNRSVVLRISYGNFSALLMADAEAPVEQRLADQHVVEHATVLKVGHHGSKTSSTSGFLAAVHPELAVISCGLNNRFGHPNADVLSRLQGTGARICRTDMDGAVVVETDGTTYSFRTAAEAAD